MADDLVRVPDGLSVTAFATDEQAHDTFVLTVHPQEGHPVVSGPGYISVLVDADRDGKAERVIPFSDLPKSGAQGLAWRGNDLLCIGDEGLLRFKDRNGDLQADGPPETLLKLKTGGEHDTHAIQQGPDGYWYLIAGNTAGVTKAFASLTTSPIKHPEGGAIIRFMPDLSAAEVIAHGFRNAYDFAFTATNSLITFESDDEREISLPWYRPTRLLQVAYGGHHGWVSKSWKQPDYFFDAPKVWATCGRGSPTGVLIYQHSHLGEEYQNAVFALDWTYGRVLVLKPTGPASWQSMPEVFMKAKGDYGFAPTDIEVADDGSLLVSVGGRGTQGGVWRVTRQAAQPSRFELPGLANGGVDRTLLLAALNAPQPLASWSRAKTSPILKQANRKLLEEIALDDGQNSAVRGRAIDALTEFHKGLSAAQLGPLLKSSAAIVRARAVWSAGVTGVELPAESLAELFIATEPEVVLATLSAVSPVKTQKLLSGEPGAGRDNLIAGLVQVLGHREASIRWQACRHLAEQSLSVVTEVRNELSKGDPNSPDIQRGQLSWAYASVSGLGEMRERIESQSAWIAWSILKAPANNAIALDACRVLQIVLGDVGPIKEGQPAFDGYHPAFSLAEVDSLLDPWRVELADRFPHADPLVSAELARLIAMVQPPNAKLLSKLLAQMTDESDPVSDLHYLYVAARVPVSRNVAQRDAIAKGFISVDQKLRRKQAVQDSSWNDRVKELYAAHCTLDPMLAVAIVQNPEFGAPSHTLFLSELPGELLPVAIGAFVKAIRASPDYPLTNELVFIVGESAEAADQELLRNWASNFAIRGAVISTLAAKPSSVDIELFYAGLEWPQLEVVEAALGAIEKLALPAEPEQIALLVSAFRRLSTDRREYLLRERVAGLLAVAAKDRFGFVAGAAGHKPQVAVQSAIDDWFGRAYPQLVGHVQTSGEQSTAGLADRLAGVDWNTGDASRGEKLYRKLACSQCHGGRNAVGPSLTGITGRFSIPDLFTSIVEPSRDVSARYQTTQIETKDGRSLSGMIVYESTDGFILRNGLGQTSRVESTDIESRRRSPVSLMPAGLLRDCQPVDYADLYAYLKSLKSDN